MIDHGLPDALRPDWPVPVRALMSTRAGGVSRPPFDSLNLRSASLPGAGDDPAAIAENERRFCAALGARPVWLEQIHGAQVVELGPRDARPGLPPPRADASVSRAPGIACAVLVADCLPVLLASPDGRTVGAAHAGWRGLAAGVIENALAALCELGACAAAEVSVWLGPCIGPQAFEVGADVVDACGGAGPRFKPCRRADGSAAWRADLAGLARDRLQAAGVASIHGGHWCTFDSPSRFFSFRRDRVTGRMAAAVAVAG